MRGFVRMLVIVSMVAAGSASADGDEVEIGRMGWFVGLSAALGGLTDNDAGTIAGAKGTTEIGAGFRVRAGNRIHSLIAAELQLEYLDNLVSRAGRSDVDVWNLTANAKVYAPPWSNGQVYLLAGAGMMRQEVESSNSADDTDFAVRFGTGVEVWLTRHVVATVEALYILPTGSLDDLDYVSGGIGLQYRF